MRCKKDDKVPCEKRDCVTVCCKYDRECEHELVLPLVDKISDKIDSVICETVTKTDCQDILSKLIYLLNILTPTSDHDTEIISIAKEGIYVGFDIYDREEVRPLIRGFVNDIISWFKGRFNGMVIDLEAFISSLKADVRSLRCLGGLEEPMSQFDLDEIFF